MLIGSHLRIENIGYVPINRRTFEQN